MKTVFETEICSRCHGSGNYSFCERYGTTCFKCAGQKVTLTKRGRIARSYFDSLCTKPLNELKIGDKIKTDGMTNNGSSFSYISIITAIESGSPMTYGTTENGIAVSKIIESICITTQNDKYGIKNQMGPINMTFKVYNEQNKENLAKALEYQENLTKQGKVKKKC